MYHTPHSLKFLRQRKFMLRLPVIAVPFITLGFMILGGGRSKTHSRQVLPFTGGINTRLPDPHFKPGKEKDKWSLYETMRMDSSRIWEAIKNDPYYTREDSPALKSPAPDNEHIIRYSPSEQKLIENLSRLQSVMNQSQQQSGSKDNSSVEQIQKKAADKINQKNLDPEMEQLNGMLDKVMAIQHPESLPAVQNRAPAENKEKPLAVEPTGEERILVHWDEKENADAGLFFGLDEIKKESTLHPAQLEATLPEPVSIVTGSTVKLELKTSLTIQSIEIPAGQILYGISSINHERAQIHISSIHAGRLLLPVSLEVYDLDGLEGIYVPGSLTREAGKESAGQAVSTVSLAGIDHSLGAQAASAGIQAAKTLFGRKIKLVQVRIQAGYQVLLKDSHPHENANQ